MLNCKAAGVELFSGWAVKIVSVDFVRGNNNNFGTAGVFIADDIPTS